MRLMEEHWKLLAQVMGGYITTGKVGRQTGFHFYEVYITEEGQAALTEWQRRCKEETDRLNAQIAGFS